MPVVVAPVVVEYVLALQPIHVPEVEAPVTAEYVPAAHATQALSAIDPVVGRYLPAPQAEHETALEMVAPQTSTSATPIHPEFLL